MTLDWCFEEQAEDVTRAMLQLLEDRSALVPVIWTLEVPNVLFVAEQRGRLERGEVERFFEMLRGLPITLAPPEQSLIPERILGLCRSHRLTTYDASYLDLAIRGSLPLATFDQALRAAAEKVGVALLPPRH